MKALQTSVIKNIEKGASLSPFLFVAENTEIANEKIKNLALELLTSFEIPKTHLSVLGAQKTIKLQEVQAFVQMMYVKPSYDFQVFFIENIENLTLAAANSLLKLLEEPGKNIIFLSTSSESSVLETILSRVQTVYLDEKVVKKTPTFYLELIKSYKEGSSNELLQYLYTSKLEQSDYLEFLDALILHARTHFELIDWLEEIESDKYAIVKNNANPRNMADSWLLKLSDLGN